MPLSDLGPVNERFDADFSAYLSEMAKAIAEAKAYAEANRNAKNDVQNLGNATIDVAARMQLMQEELDRAKDNERQMSEQIVLLNNELRRLREESLRTSESVHHLGESAENAARKLALLDLAGLGAVSHMATMVGLMGALVVAASGLAPAVAAVGLGFGAFGALAIPTLHSVFTGLHNVSLAQNAVNNATTAAAKSTALARLHQIWSNMPAPIAATVKEIEAFKKEFTALAAKSGIQGSVLADVTKVLGILRNILPTIIPLAQQGAKAFGHMLDALGNATKSAGFLTFMRTMTSMVVPAAAALGHLAGAITGVLGHSLMSIAPMSIPFTNMLTRIVHALGGPLVAALHLGVQLLLGLGHALMPLLPGLSKFATVLINDVSAGFKQLAPILHQIVAQLAGPLLNVLHSLQPILANLITPNSPFMFALRLMPSLLSVIAPLLNGIASILSNPFFSHAAVGIMTAVVAFKALQAVMGWFSAIGSIVSGIIAFARSEQVAAVASKVMAAAQWLLNAALDANPIGIIIIAIAALVAAFILLWTHCKGFRDFWKAVWRDIVGAFQAAWNMIKSIFSWIQNAVASAIDFIRGHWSLILGILIGPIGIAVKFIIDHWNQIVTGVQNMVHNVISWFHNLVSSILGVVSGFGSLLWNAGKALIQGLISGITSMFSSLTSIIGSIAGKIASLKGPLPKDLALLVPHGKAIMQGLMDGIGSRQAELHRMIESITSSVPVSGATGLMLGRYQGSPGGGPVQPGGSVGGGAGGGNLIIQVDGKTLLTIVRSELYKWNRSNGATVTGVLVPG